MMQRICDLHTHSVFSDGTDKPADIVAAAVKANLSAVALCDHNTVDGLPEFLSAAKGKPLEAIAGAEFSVDYNRKELHLLGLFLPEASFAPIGDLMRSAFCSKEESNLLLIEALRRAGYPLDYEKIKSAIPNGRVNRAHIAAEMLRLGYVATREEAFDGLLSPEAGLYKEPVRISFFEMLDFLTSFGCRPVLAHPFLQLTEEELAAFLPTAKARGLVGMECRYSLYDVKTTEKSLAMANAFGLLPSGGSDYHGANKPDIALGTGRGNLSVPYEYVTMLKTH
jgi:predicted metal-dependent phosphoesterase TrpH